MKLINGMLYGLLLSLSLNIAALETTIDKHISPTNPEDTTLSSPQSLPRNIGGVSWASLVVPTYVNYYKEDHLMEDFWRHIAFRGLQLSQQQADLLVEEVRFHAEKTGLNEKFILNVLLRSCKEIAEDNKKHIGQKWDFFDLALSSLFCAGGLTVTILIAREVHNDKVTATVLCALPAFCATSGAIGLYRSLVKSPPFKERYAKYKALTDALENALIHPRNNITFY